MTTAPLRELKPLLHQLLSVCNGSTPGSIEEMCETVSTHLKSDTKPVVLYVDALVYKDVLNEVLKKKDLDVFKRVFALNHTSTSNVFMADFECLMALKIRNDRQLEKDVVQLLCQEHSKKCNDFVLTCVRMKYVTLMQEFLSTDVSVDWSDVLLEALWRGNNKPICRLIMRSKPDIIETAEPKVARAIAYTGPFYERKKQCEALEQRWNKMKEDHRLWTIEGFKKELSKSMGKRVVRKRKM